ncbi:MAG: hypothetical protein ACRD3Q_18570 [Terriglobales bacterium]
MSADIEIVQGAIAKFDAVSAGIAELTQKYGGVLFEVTTSEGMEAAKAARAAVRQPRYDIESIRKSAKAPLLAIGKRLDSEAARITDALMKIEMPIHSQIAAEETRKEQEKQRRIDAEIKRVADIRERINEIRGLAAVAGAESALVAEHLDDIENIPVDASFEEFMTEARDAKIATLAQLRQIYVAAIEREAEAARIKAEREELAKLRAEQEERNRQERERLAAVERQQQAARAEEDRQARVSREAEASALAALRVTQEEELRARQAEQDRIERAAREAREAEERRIAEERAELARRFEALRIANLPKPAPPKPRKAPPLEDIVKVLATHYGVEAQVVMKWLRKLNLNEETA